MASHEFGLFGRSIAGVDCPGRGKCTRGYNMCGTCYRIFGRGHRGHIWVYDGGSFSVVRYKVAFTEDSVLDIHIPGAFIISRFQNRFTGKNFAIRTFCNCEGSEKKFSFCEGEIVKGTEIILTNDFCTKLCCTNAAFCNGMCKQISQSQDSPLNLNLVRIFNQINSCNFHATAARIYLESKVLEMFALFTADCKEGTLNESADTADTETFGVIIRGYIESNYKTGLSVDTLAKFACMSASKFKAEFKKTFGKSVLVYIREVRMEKAKWLLTQTALTVEAVAAEVGYKKAGAFAAVFQKYTGQLPRDYRADQKIKYTGVQS